MEKTNFKIAFGDWSGDGHSICEYIEYETNKSIEEVRQAYFNAKEKLGTAYPETLACDYQDTTLEPETVEELSKLGFEFTEKEYMTLDDMISLTEWFIKQGDDKLELKRLEKPTMPMLQFYGYDRDNNHISGFGYGLFD